MRSLCWLARRRSAVGSPFSTERTFSTVLFRRPFSTEPTRSRLPASKLPPLTYEDNVRLRGKHLAPALKAHYQESKAGPLKLSFGEGQYLYDQNGVQYLDCVNNVCHVGHCHPKVVQAAAAQLSMLNTNSRYLHDNIVRLATQVTDTMPDSLDVAIFVNSGSEANDLALRLARNHTQRKHVYCIDGAYHGNTASTLAISPYSKYSSVEMEDGVSKVRSPDAYRLGLTAAGTTSLCLSEFEEALAGAHSETPPAAFIAESLICCGGQVVLPEGYLTGMHSLVRAHGGVAIADEVQTGFGRVGSHMWAFEAHGATPDIVTLGKPFGNGFPLSAVITTSEVALSSGKIEYFNTFGGNPVACAVGMAVLNVIEEEGLQENARVVGQYTRDLINAVATKHEAIGDVRGMGLLFGFEFVKDRATREPDPNAARHVMHWMRDNANVLVSTDGPYRNVIKVKPPLCFTKADGERLAAALDGAMAAR